MNELLAHVSIDGAVAVISRISPALFIVEVVFLVYTYRSTRDVWVRALKLPLVIQLGHVLFGSFLYVEAFINTQSYFAKFAPLQVSVSLIGFVYAYVVWELGHYIHHWTCHKVRLLWCIHAPHHAPDHMNLSVAGANFFYQATYAVFVRTAVCAALGVPPPLLVFIMAIDGCWGSLIHVSEEIWRRGRLPGWLGRFILSPIHHRIHHASNPEYIDRNYCNTLPLWDKVFGTFQDAIEGVPPRYGITRGVKPGSFVDLYFGEFMRLAVDVARAGSLRDSILYVVMPPGWKPKADEPGVTALASEAGETKH